ncbi:MAG TPA: RNA polymerase sigma factor, partial [Sediminispirochaeta sp.]|nr:RNA polymerase sigma factor [Sediminispirochaeta sp.]
DITLARDGDSAAFRRIVRRYTPLIYSLCRRMLGSTEEAEDAVQDIFFKVYRSLDTFDPSRRFYSWLYTIAVNHLRSLQRKRSTSPSKILPFDHTVDDSVRMDRHTQGPDENTISKEGERLAQRALDRLEVDYREVFTLRVVEGLSVRDSAEILGIPENTVKVKLHRAKKQMLEIMKKFEWE